MKKHVLILFLLTLTSIAGFAQDVKKPQPDSLIKVIPIKRGFYGMYSGYNVPYGYAESFLYTIGGKLVNEEDVASRLLNYGPSAAEYNAAKNNMRVGYILYGGAAVASIGSVLAFVGGTKTVPTTYTANGLSVTGSAYQHNYTGAVILTGAALGLATAAIITMLHGPRHLSKSVRLYNQRYQ